MDGERGWWARLLAADGIGPSMARRLVAALGSAHAVCTAGVGRLHQSTGLAYADATRLIQSIRAVDIDREQHWLSQHSGRLIPFGHSEYPSTLVQIPDAPGVLRVQGVLPSAEQPIVAIVGTRRCSPYGLRQAGRFTRGLVEAGCCIVSGGARGIDAEVHRMALRCGGSTVVVLGSGLARRYPPEHDELFDRIVDSGGALVSEVGVHHPPRPWLFPRRNRIVSGLALGVLVIEAPERSGAMITARLAVEDHGRDAMVVPGPADSITHSGGHRAIQQGWAHLVMSPDEAVAVLLQDQEGVRRFFMPQ